MDKLKMQTPNKANENFEKLAAMFPNAVTETVDENGEVVRAIDKDILMQEINCKVVDGNEERYQFTWPDKKQAILTANAPINKTLRPCREESVDFDNTENLYIEGDNLEVLKLLQETYLSKIKMIYIDPPYNTGNDFVYEDDFTIESGVWSEKSGDFDEEGNRLFRNTDSNGRFHTDWLNMIYPRLKLAKDLLSDDGVIFISIDDNEIDNLRKICDEIFGVDNIIANFIIVSNSAKNNSKYVSITHEYLLCIAKDKSKTPVDWATPKTNLESFINICNSLISSNKSFDDIHSELLSLVKYPKYYEFDHYTYVDERGPFRASDLTAPSSKQRYDILHPVTHKPCKIGTRGWAYTEKELKRLVNDNYILFGKDETVMPQLKNYLFENKYSLPKSVLFFDSQSSTKWMKSQSFGFDFPKAVDYIKYIISAYPQNDYTILDFFSGSATTAHAVMQLNAEDGGHRKFIMVQLPELTDEKSEAYKAGYKNICEIGKERIRRAGTKIKSEVLSVESGVQEQLSLDNSSLLTPNSSLDIGFRVLKLDSSNMKDVYYNPADYEPSMFESLTDNIKEDRTPEDLLFQVMLDLGILLSSKIECEVLRVESEVDNSTLHTPHSKLYKYYSVADNFLIACFDEDVTDEVITKIAKKKPYYFVMRDSSMASDSVATNFEQIFATYSPETEWKAL